MAKILVGIAALIVSLSVLLVAVGVFGLLQAQRVAVTKQVQLTDKSAHVLDGIISTLLLKTLKPGKDIEPEAHTAILAELQQNSRNGYVFERILLALKWDKEAADGKDVVPAEAEAGFLDGVREGYAAAAEEEMINDLLEGDGDGTCPPMFQPDEEAEVGPEQEQPIP